MIRTVDRVVNVGWAVLGLGICAYSVRLGLWTPSGPDSGFMPFCAGVVIGLLGLVRVVSTWSTPEPRGAFWDEPTAGFRVVGVLLALCAMAVLMPWLGFLLTSILVLTFLLRVTGIGRLVTSLALSVLSSLLLYWLFHALLQVRLPQGPLGF